MTIFTEITPNPATLKFVVADRIFLQKGSMDFPDPEAAKGKSGLAAQLFEFRFVNAVMVGFNFVTVTKDPAFKWDEVIPEVKNTIRAYLETGNSVVEAREIPVEQTAGPGDDSEVVKKIKALLDENVRPAVAMDGGDIAFDSFQDGIVKLKMHGSCSGCPSSTMTLKMGIEGLLTRFIPEVKSVEAV